MTTLEEQTKSTESLILEESAYIRNDAEVLNSIADQLSDLMLKVPRIGLETERLSEDRSQVYDDVVDDLIQLLTKKVKHFRAEANEKESLAMLLEMSVKHRV